MLTTGDLHTTGKYSSPLEINMCKNIKTHSDTPIKMLFTSLLMNTPVFCSLLTPTYNSGSAYFTAHYLQSMLECFRFSRISLT